MFGSLIVRKRTIIGRISGVQKALERRSNPRLVQLEIDLQAELEDILDNEEILWRQKSRCEWLADGDRNTKYYHSRTMARRRRNKISALRLQDNSWCYDDAMLKQEAIDFFSNLYTVEGQPPGPFSNTGFSEVSIGLVMAFRIPLIGIIVLLFGSPLRRWDWPQFCNYVDEMVAMQIVAMKPPAPHNNGDGYMWRWSKKGNFNIADTFGALSQASNNPTDDKWN
ncbi:hypothetical protein K2173_014137 [Erythroxylum novogranatense]|uniref:Uncharacterized protein n=1 Tax=Erythroxylum novogranatense TaxID=1862640 RepID=A0AAV8SDF0_9ROSI|nr:hypothetical protein K2173_014137 [Erythroxylum novogranatense]